MVSNAEALGRPLRCVYKVVDGQEIDVDVYLPRPTSQNKPKNGYCTRKPAFLSVIPSKKPRPNLDTALSPAVIDIHGGAFMLGHAGMVNKDQIRDCLDRSWIVLVPNHRLCPQVDLYEGPMQDCRDLLAWVYSEGEGLSAALQLEFREEYPLDLDHVFAMGTSSGGTLALSLVSTVSQLCKQLHFRRGTYKPFSTGLWCATSSSRHLRYVRPMQFYRTIMGRPTTTRGRQTTTPSHQGLHLASVPRNSGPNQRRRLLRGTGKPQRSTRLH